jgi:predicted RNA binding protein YcfA (HicA-like mRNA interferase family)
MRHLRDHGCYVLRDKGKHTVVCNAVTGQVSSVPRHTEINDFTARGICKQLGIPVP